MKVILIKDVKGVGRAYETVDMADGYALNFLIPKKLALVATPAAVKEAALRQKQMGDRATLDTALLTQNIASLAEVTITLTMKANEKGHLYNAVDAADIVAAAKASAHIDLPVEAVKLEKPIKELGTFEIPVAMGDVFGKFSLTIEAE